MSRGPGVMQTKILHALATAGPRLMVEFFYTAVDKAMDWDRRVDVDGSTRPREMRFQDIFSAVRLPDDPWLRTARRYECSNVQRAVENLLARGFVTRRRVAVWWGEAWNPSRVYALYQLTERGASYLNATGANGRLHSLTGEAAE